MIEIKIEQDGMFEIDCINIDCRNNLINHKKDEWACNLKKVIIGDGGVCEDYITLEKPEKSVPVVSCPATEEDELEEGYYKLTVINLGEEQEYIVRLYRDTIGVLIIGYNAHDGGHHIPFNDVMASKSTARFEKVHWITEDTCAEMRKELTNLRTMFGIKG